MAVAPVKILSVEVDEGSGVVRIVGENLTFTEGDVMMGGEPLEILSWADTEIIAAAEVLVEGVTLELLVYRQPGDYRLNVTALETLANSCS